MGDSVDPALTATPDYAQAYRDDRVLLATIVVAASDDGSDAPTIMPFNGNVQTISATAIAANSITAANIKAGVITTAELNFSPNTDSTSSIVASALGGNHTGLVGGISNVGGLANSASQPGDNKTQGELASWKLNGYNMYSGSTSPAQTLSGYLAAGQKIAFNSSGSINAENFYINSTGTMALKGAIEGTSSINIGDDGNDGTTAGKITLTDQNNTQAVRLRTFAAYVQFDYFSKPFYFVPSGTSGGTVTISDHAWAEQYQFVGITNQGYIGSPTVAPYGLGVGAVVFQNKAGNNGTVCVIAPDFTGVQRLITLPSGGDFDFNGGSNGQVLSTNGSGALSWVAQTVDTNTIYSGWIPAGVTGDTGDLITSGQTVAFHGSGGISTAYSSSTNTLTISYSSSSQRYKENIENLTLDTSKIYNLVPRTFTWKANSPNGLDGQSDFGLVAEEAKVIIPELVFNNQDDEVEGVKYMTLSVLLLEELKKLKARIEVLEGA